MVRCADTVQRRKFGLPNVKRFAHCVTSSLKRNINRKVPHLSFSLDLYTADYLNGVKYKFMSDGIGALGWKSVNIFVCLISVSSSLFLDLMLSLNSFFLRYVSNDLFRTSNFWFSCWSTFLMFPFRNHFFYTWWFYYHVNYIFSF